MAIKKTNQSEVPDRLVFSSSGMFLRMEILVDAQYYSHPTLAVRIHFKSSEDMILTFRHVSGFKAAMVDAWCGEALDLEIWDVGSRQLENVRYNVVDGEQSERLNFYCHSFETLVNGTS